MKPNITLKRNVTVQCWRVVGQIAKATKRKELIPILLRVRDQEGRSDAKDIAEHLFFEARSRKVVAERLLQVAKSYQLLEENQRRFTITKEGLKAIESVEVFVPEDGTWTLWTSQDQLLGSRVLRVEAWDDPSAYDTILGKAKKAIRKFIQLPDWLSNVVGQIQHPCAGSGQSLRVEKLKEEGEEVPSNATLSIEWRVNTLRLKITGKVGDHQMDTDLDPPEVSHAEVWRQLLLDKGIWYSWDTTREALLVKFDDTEEVERESMTRALHIDRPRIRRLGRFDSLTVRGVGLAASSQADAERWARWRIDSRIQEYATQHRMDAWTQDAQKPFVDHPINLPDRRELARDAWDARGKCPSPRTWHLVAAEDWKL